MEETKEAAAQITAELERVRKELEQARAAHAQEHRSRVVREAVGAAMDHDVAALLVERTLAQAGVPATGGELPAAVKKAVEQIRREKPWLFESAARTLPGRSAISAPEGGRDRDDAPLRSAADQARSSGDRRDLIHYLSLRARRD